MRPATTCPAFSPNPIPARGAEYTGSVGIPEITVSPNPRITDAASLYTLGIAYAITPDGVERLLEAHWGVVSQLLTDHGPWEGYNTSKKEVIRFQTTVHTLSLILGVLNTASENMARYLDSKGLGQTLTRSTRPAASSISCRRMPRRSPGRPTKAASVLRATPVVFISGAKTWAKWD